MNMSRVDFDVDLQVASEGYDRKSCWVHPRAGHIPQIGAAVMTMQKLRLTGEDVFYALHELRTDDCGKTWGEPVAHNETLGRRLLKGGAEEVASDFTPAWHAATRTLLGTGHTVYYLRDDLTPPPRPRNTIYSTYDPAGRSWSAWKKLELPDIPIFAAEGAAVPRGMIFPTGKFFCRPTASFMAPCGMEPILPSFEASPRFCAVLSTEQPYGISSMETS